jgi:hypothetical protein
VHEVRLVSGVVVEPVGDDVVVMTPGNSQVLRLHGTAAELVKRVTNGESIDASSDDVMHLIQSGVLEMSGGMSRRGLITAGTVGVGAGISMLAMPSVAMASSDPQGFDFTFRAKSITEIVPGFFRVLELEFADQKDAPTPPGVRTNIATLTLASGTTSFWNWEGSFWDWDAGSQPAPEVLPGSTLSYVVDGKTYIGQGVPGPA